MIRPDLGNRRRQSRATWLLGSLIRGAALGGFIFLMTRPQSATDTN